MPDGKNLNRGMSIEYPLYIGIQPEIYPISIARPVPNVQKAAQIVHSRAVPAANRPTQPVFPRNPESALAKKSPASR